MTVPVDKVAERYFDIEANVAVVCGWTLFDPETVYVYYGDDWLEAVRNTDYTVTLNSPTYTSFTITPKPSLLTKIGSGTNRIEVRRTLSLVGDASETTARSSVAVARAFDRDAMRLQQLGEELDRVFKLEWRDDTYDMTMPEYEANKALSWHPTEKRLVNSVQDVNESPTALAVASAASASANAAIALASKLAAEAAAEAAEAIAGAGTGLPSGGDIGDVLRRTGTGPTDREWQALVLDTAADLAGFGDGGVPELDDTAAGNEGTGGGGQKWTWANVVQLVASQLMPAGHVDWFLRSTAPAGWVQGGGTIGNAASGATTRANADTAALFALAWALNATDAPIFTSAGAPSSRGADAATDFAANKRIALPDLRGESIRGWDNGRGVDASRRLGSAQSEMIGPHNHVFVGSAMAPHAHTFTAHGRSRRGANGDNTGTNWYGSSGDSNDGSTASKATSDASAGTPAGTINNNSGTENRVRNIALLGCYKL